MNQIYDTKTICILQAKLVIRYFDETQLTAAILIKCFNIESLSEGESLWKFDHHDQHSISASSPHKLVESAIS